MDLFDLTGKNAIVTGGSGTVSGAMLEALALAGANVATTYNKHRDALDKRLEHLDRLGVRGTIKSYQLNICDKDAIREHADRVMEDFGRIDIVVNAAGGRLPGTTNEDGLTIYDLDIDLFEEMLRINLLGGCVWPTIFYSKKMLDNPEGGSIINIASMTSYRPLEGRAAYGVAKAGVVNFTMWMATHLAKDLNPKIRVNAIAPGFYPNGRTSQTMVTPDGTLGWRGKKIIAHTPMGRLGNMEDLYGAVIWYASDASRYVTGTVTPVDGGFTAYAGM